MTRDPRTMSTMKKMAKRVADQLHAPNAYTVRASREHRIFFAQEGGKNFRLLAFALRNDNRFYHSE